MRNRSKAFKASARRWVLPGDRNQIKLWSISSTFCCGFYLRHLLFHLHDTCVCWFFNLFYIVYLFRCWILVCLFFSVLIIHEGEQRYSSLWTIPQRILSRSWGTQKLPIIFNNFGQVRKESYVSYHFRLFLLHPHTINQGGTWWLFSFASSSLLPVFTVPGIGPQKPSLVRSVKWNSKKKGIVNSAEFLVLWRVNLFFFLTPRGWPVLQGARRGEEFFELLFIRRQQFASFLFKLVEVNSASVVI